MDQTKFSKNSPGQIVETEVWVDRVRRGVPERVPVRCHAFVPDLLPPKLDWAGVCGRLTAPLLEAQKEVARLDGVASRLPTPHLLLRPLLIREGMASSKIENIETTMIEVALERAGVRLGKEENKLVLNYVAALDLGLSSEFPIGHKLVHEMHRILLSGVEGSEGHPGKYRDKQNMIGRPGAPVGDARFVPPPPGLPLHERMTNLLAFMRDPPDEIPSLVAVALGHYQFETLHPYEDGNGRVGRLLVSLCLCRYGLLSQPLGYVSGYFERHRRAYYDSLLRVSTDGAWEAWIELFLKAVASETKAAAKRADRLFDTWEDLFNRVGSRRTSVLLRKLVDYLFEKQAVTISDVREVLDITDTAARRHVARMIELGILEPDKNHTHPQVYVAHPIIRAAEDHADEAIPQPPVRR